MSIELINGEQFQDLVHNKKETCLVIFSKESCSVCKQLKPIIEKVADTYTSDSDESVHFYTMDVKTDDGLAVFKSLELMGVPQTVFFRHGERKEALPGAISESIIRKEIDNMIHPNQGLFGKLKGLFGK